MIKVKDVNLIKRIIVQWYMGYGWALKSPRPKSMKPKMPKHQNPLRRNLENRNSHEKKKKDK